MQDFDHQARLDTGFVEGLGFSGSLRLLYSGIFLKSCDASDGTLDSDR